MSVVNGSSSVTLDRESSPNEITSQNSSPLRGVSPLSRVSSFSINIEGAASRPVPTNSPIPEKSRINKSLVINIAVIVLGVLLLLVGIGLAFPCNFGLLNVSSLILGSAICMVVLGIALFSLGLGMAMNKQKQELAKAHDQIKQLHITTDLFASQNQKLHEQNNSSEARIRDLEEQNKLHIQEKVQLQEVLLGFNEKIGERIGGIAQKLDTISGLVSEETSNVTEKIEEVGRNNIQLEKAIEEELIVIESSDEDSQGTARE